MEQSATNRELALYYKPPLLMFESQEEFERLQTALQQQIMPSDYIEQLFVDDLVDGDWQLQRLRRAKVKIIKTAYLEALRHLIQMATGVFNSEYVGDRARRYFTNQRVRRQVLADLQAIGLDEAAIDAVAVRQSMEELEPLEERIDKLEARRDRILRSIEDRRAGLATRVAANADQCTDAEAEWTLVGTSKVSDDGQRSPNRR
jgi:hypothetical protein